MPRRVESPSSINTYKQCPRKYFYCYIKKLPTYPNIHTLRGNIVHSTLEKFFEIDPAAIDPLKYRPELAGYLSNLFEALWRKKAKQLEKVTFSEEQERTFYEDSRMMLGNWLNDFFARVNTQMQDKGFVEAFNVVKPFEMEQEYKSELHHVRGFIDVIEKQDNKVKVVDYKTGKPKPSLPPDYRLQLAIYALLYKEKHGVLPDEASVWFLKKEEIIVKVDEEFAKEAAFQIEQIHASTESDKIMDYPVNITPLCKWNGGQCDFYDVCVKDRHIQ